MPATRAPAHRELTSYHDLGGRSPQSIGAHLDAPQLSRASTASVPDPSANSPTSKKRTRPPNAFILFRSYVIANNFIPPHITHQSDISRHVADVWRSLTASEREVFFKKAQEEKLRFEIEGPREPAKRKRTRSRKAFPPSTPGFDAQLYLPSGPVLALDGSTSPSASNMVTLSPQSCPTPTLYPSSTVSNVLVPPSAPQPVHAIPLSLFDWGYPEDAHNSDASDKRFDVYDCSLPAHESSMYQNGANGNMAFGDLNALQVELDFLLSGMDTSLPACADPNFLSPLAYASPFESLNSPFDV